MKESLRKNWFKVLTVFLLLITTIGVIVSTYNSIITKEKIENLNFNLDFGSIPGNVEDAMYYAERAADACENIDTGSAEDAADYAAEASEYAQEASQYAQKAAKSSSDAYYRCATPSDLLIYCR